MEDRRSTSPTIYKLTQKIPGSGPAALVTNIYLSPAEYELLLQLGGDRIRKVRYGVPPLGVDVFLEALEGLVLAEAEFESEEAMVAFTAPEEAVAEVTADERFTGGQLARTARAELTRHLNTFGLQLGARA